MQPKKIDSFLAAIYIIIRHDFNEQSMTNAKPRFQIVVHEENCAGCRICQLHCSFLHQKRFAPLEAYIQVIPYELTPKISFNSEKCDHCGQCARHCLYGALELVEEGKK